MLPVVTAGPTCQCSAVVSSDAAPCCGQVSGRQRDLLHPGQRDARRGPDPVKCAAVLPTHPPADQGTLSCRPCVSPRRSKRPRPRSHDGKLAQLIAGTFDGKFASMCIYAGRAPWQRLSSPAAAVRRLTPGCRKRSAALLPPIHEPNSYESPEPVGKDHEVTNIVA